MKKIILTSLVALGIVSGANAGVYLSGYVATPNDDKAQFRGNEADTSIDFADNLSLSASVGYEFSNGLRLEADVFQAQVYESGRSFGETFATQVGLSAFKAIYDFKSSGKFVPYIGVGLDGDPVLAVAGSGWLSYENDGGAFAFTGLGLAGVKFEVNNKFAIDLQYIRKFSYNSNGENVDASYNGINIVKVGGIYKF
jgi:outer membrane protein W